MTSCGKDTSKSQSHLPSKLLGQPQIIANIHVRKFMNPKRITAPNGIPLGLSIQAVPQLGIGVNLVCESSIFYNFIRRGDIFTEFMGQCLKNVSAKEFVTMLRRKDIETGSRILVIEYTAADRERLFNKILPGNSSSSSTDKHDKVAVPSKLTGNKKGSIDEEIDEETKDNVGRKELLQQDKQPNLLMRDKAPIEKDMSKPSVFATLGPSSGGNKSNLGTKPDAPNSENEQESTQLPNKIPPSNLNITTNTNTPKLSFTSKLAEKNKINITHSKNVTLEPNSKVSLSKDSFHSWLSNRKDEWKSKREKASGDGNKIKPSRNTLDEELTERKNTTRNVKKASTNPSTDAGAQTHEYGSKFKYVPATSFGLPDGWTVRIQPRSRYTFRSPTGKLFYSKTKLYEYLGIDMGFATTKSTKALHDVIKIKLSEKSIDKAVDDGNSQNQDLVQFSSKPIALKELKVYPKNPGNVPNQTDNDKSTSSNSTNNGEHSDRYIPPTSSNSSPEEEKNTNVHSISNQEESECSLIDVIVKIHEAREKVAEFGPIPWEGCQIVKCPPAPTFLGLQIQNLPSKFGCGIVSVLDEKSPFYGKVERGDIITHFMQIPLYGLGVDDIKRLLHARNEGEREFQIAPKNFNFNDIPEKKVAEAHCTYRQPLKKVSEQCQSKNDSTPSLNEIDPSLITTTSTKVHVQSKGITASNPCNPNILHTARALPKDTAQHSSTESNLTHISPVPNSTVPVTNKVQIKDNKAAEKDKEAVDDSKKVTTEKISHQNDVEGDINQTKPNKFASSTALHDNKKLQLDGQVKIIQEEKYHESEIETSKTTMNSNANNFSRDNRRREPNSLRCWTIDEDNLVRTLVEKHGTEDWDLISLELPKKTAPQCRYRWINVIRPSLQVRRKDFTKTMQTKNSTEPVQKPKNSASYKKVLLSPFEGPLGMNVQQLPNGIGIVNVTSESPFYQKLHRGDIIIKFMEKPLQGMGVKEFIEMVNDTKNENCIFIVSSSCQSSTKPREERVQVNVGKQPENTEAAKTFTVEVKDFVEFDLETIRQMPICFAFDPSNSESQVVAAKKQKRCLEQHANQSKKQKLVQGS